jgi:intracellular septation protein
MKFLFDFFPILLFFGVFKLAEHYEQASFDLVSSTMGSFVAGGAVTPDVAPIMLATVVAMIASCLQIAYLKLRGRKVDGMLWISFLIITVFGGLTIYFHDATFIKWKPTIIYWLFALGMFISQFIFGKNMMRQAMEQQIKLPEDVWKKVGLSWMLFFLLLGFVNLVAAFVVFKDNDSAWVSFKLFGINGLLIAFIIGQTFFLSKYIEEDDKAEEQA